MSNALIPLTRVLFSKPNSNLIHSLALLLVTKLDGSSVRQGQRRVDPTEPQPSKEGDFGF